MCMSVVRVCRGDHRGNRLVLEVLGFYAADSSKCAVYGNNELCLRSLLVLEVFL